MNRPDILNAVEPVIKGFEQLGTDYYIGGSIASSAYGMARATLDVDMVSDLRISICEENHCALSDEPLNNL
jgi:hypothetical protein